MHTLLLENVKRHLDHYKEKGYLNNPEVEVRLAKMPWTAGRLYSDILAIYLSYIVNSTK